MGTDETLDCLILGAGMAGLIAARELKRAGLKIIVIDKGRGVGGRMATRRLGDAVIDHGAQFFTVRDPKFGQWVGRWRETGAVSLWCHGFLDANQVQKRDGHSRFRGVPGMTGIAKSLAAELPVQTATRISSVAPARVERADGPMDGWRVTAESGEVWNSRALVLTAPVPQSLALLHAGGSILEEPVKLALDRIQYDPCFALLARWDGPTCIPAPGAFQIKGEPLAFIADNQQKGVSPEPAVTIHAGPRFSRDHLETDKKEIAASLLEAAKPYLAGQPVETQVMRWLYAQPSVLHPERTLIATSPALAAFAGDAFGEARVEGAALSGLTAARGLLAHLTQGS